MKEKNENTQPVTRTQTHEKKKDTDTVAHKYRCRLLSFLYLLSLAHRMFVVLLCLRLVPIILFVLFSSCSTYSSTTVTALTTSHSLPPALSTVGAATWSSENFASRLQERVIRLSKSFRRTLELQRESRLHAHRSVLPKDGARFGCLASSELVPISSTLYISNTAARRFSGFHGFAFPR